MRKTYNGSPGLWVTPNPELAPPGALKQALGYVIKRPGILEKSRPFRQYSVGIESTYGSASVASALGFFGGRFYTTQADGKLNAETGVGTGIFTQMAVPSSFTGGVSPQDSADSAWIRSLESNGNYYIATASGSLKSDAAGAAPYMTGVPRAPDPQLTLAAAGSLLASTNSVGYRVVFGLLDANKNLILGPPTGRVIFTATGAQDVTVKSFIPASIIAAANGTSYFVQVYRTAVQTISGVDPGEEMQVAYQAGITATDIANKYIQFTDNTPDGLRGAALYTSPSQQGIAQANQPPPIAQDVALFRGASFYANTTQKHRAQLQLNGIGKNTLTITTAAGGITKSGGSGIATFLNAPDLTNIPTDGTAKISITGSTTAANNGEFPITAVVAATSITYTNAGAFTEPGTASSRAFPSKLTIAGVSYYGSLNGTETPASQIYALSTAGTSSQNVQNSCYSLLRVVNQQAAPVVYGFYESGPDDGAGRMSFEALNLGAASFTISGAGTLFYNSFTPTIPTTNVITSANDAKINRLYYSKPNQPEHVPLAQYFDIGSQSKNILRIVPLREATLVFKEDGLYRVSGDGSFFSVALFDATLILVSKGAVTTCANRSFAVCTRGAFTINELTASRIDESVASVIRTYIESTATFSVVANEIDGFVQIVSVDSNASYRHLTYGVYSSSWTEQVVEAGTVQYAKLPVFAVGGLICRLGNGSGPNSPNFSWSGDIYKEDVYSATDSELANNSGAPIPAIKNLVNLTAVDTVGRTLTPGAAFTNFNVGSYILTNHGPSRIYKAASNAGGGKFNMVFVAGVIDTFDFVTGHAIQIFPQSSTLEWVPFTAGDDGNYSRLREAAILLDGASTMTTATMSAYTEATSSTLIGSMNSTNTPLPTGIATQTLFRSIVPLNMQQARRLSVIFQHNTVAEYVFVRGISYEYEPSIDSHEVT